MIISINKAYFSHLPAINHCHSYIAVDFLEMFFITYLALVLLLCKKLNSLAHRERSYMYM